MKIDKFIKNAGIMFIATQITNVFNLLYQLFMVRALTPADFGLLDKLMGLTLITAMPTGTFQAVVTKFISGFKAEENWLKIHTFLCLFFKKMALVAGILLVIFACFKEQIAIYYKTDNSLLIIMVGLLLFLSTIFPLNMGGLQGLQKFKSLGTASILNSFLRLSLGIMFVKFGFRVAGALGAVIIATFLGLIAAFIPLRKYFFFSNKTCPKQQQKDLNLPAIYQYCFPAFVALFSFALLTNMDLQLISPFFSAQDAGYFAVARMVGKIILYLPGAVTIVMFPKVSERFTKNKNTTKILKKSLLIVGLLCFLSGIICVIFPEQILKVLTGSAYSQSVSLVIPFVVSMSFYALSSVFLYYYLSVHNMKFIYIFMLFALLQGILIRTFHNSLTQVLYIMCGCAIILFFINTLGINKAIKT